MLLMRSLSISKGLLEESLTQYDWSRDVEECSNQKTNTLKVRDGEKQGTAEFQMKWVI